jgi:hypothetical protein
MIGNPKWFARRKYGGWGFRPKTWQGWLYLALMLIPLIVFHSLEWSNQTRVYVTIGWLAFFLLDGWHIVMALKKDELEYKIEAISERNAAWAMVSVLVLGILYEIINGAFQQKIEINPFLIGALFAGAIVKTISNIYLGRKGV